MKKGVSCHSDEVGVAPIKDETAQGLPICKEQGEQCYQGGGHHRVDRIGRRNNRRRSSVRGGLLEQEQCCRQHCKDVHIKHGFYSC